LTHIRPVRVRDHRRRRSSCVFHVAPVALQVGVAEAVAADAYREGNGRNRVGTTW